MLFQSKNQNLNVLYPDGSYFHKVETETPYLSIKQMIQQEIRKSPIRAARKCKIPVKEIKEFLKTGKIARIKYKKLKKKLYIKPSRLNKKERAFLEERIFPECRAAYINRMIRSGHKNPAYEFSDLENDALLHFRNILGKFDKARCGEIGDKDVRGRKNKKTLEWYFYNYYCQRVNWTARDNTTKRSSMVDEAVDYGSGIDVENSQVVVMKDRSYILPLLIKEIRKLSPRAFNMFKKRFLVSHMDESDLKKYFEDYDDLNDEINLFLEKFKHKYKEHFIDELGTSLFLSQAGVFERRRPGRRKKVVAA